MTRLIEADALKAQIQREIDIYFDEVGGGIHTAMEARDEIDYAPTVDAIPVDWIEAYAINLENKEKANCYAYRGYAEGAEWIRSMIREWRENE